MASDNNVCWAAYESQHKLRAGAATDKTDFFLRKWSPRYDRFMRGLDGCRIERLGQ